MKRQMAEQLRFCPLILDSLGSTKQLLRAPANITLATFPRKKRGHSSLRRSYLYRLRGALHLAGKALYAVFLSYRVRFFFRKRVPRRVNQLVQRNGANVNAHTVSSAGIPVNSTCGSMNSQFLRGFNGAPNFVSVMFADNLAFCLKIRVDRQKIHRLKSPRRQILGFL